MPGVEIKLYRLVAALSLLAFAATCGKNIAPGEHVTLKGKGYIIEIQGELAVILATDKASREAALSRICRDKFCTIEPVGTAYRVEIGVER